MEQLTQNLKSGEMRILEVPYPVLSQGAILVRNHFSVISAGTEGKTVKDARLGYVGKAMARKEEVKKVIRTARTIGLAETYKIMMNKLDAPSPLGYSCSGEVLAVADDVTGFKVGDRVACAGAGAVHAEVVAVPKNLCVKLPANVTCDEAAFATIGAIALQGIRQADLRLGENCVVIGLGLIGQLTMQLLQAAGVKPIGIDINDTMVGLSKELGAAYSFNRNTDALEAIIAELTNGYGADAVIITAGSASTDPVDFAGAICRQKGKVVIVGNVPTGFKRAGYYKKELELRMSCSYGPGRYDRGYEEGGLDYPYGYVRWTENRNMQAFIDLLGQKKIDVQKIITHRFDFKRSPEAYQLILGKSEPFLGILLQYDITGRPAHRVELKTNPALSPGEANIAFIGAGSFAANVLLPALKGHCRFTGIVSGRANQSLNMADKYGFAYCSNTAEEIFADKNTSAVFIATRHDSHAKYVLQALDNKKHVFVEKPLCLHEEELDLIKNKYKEAGVSLMLGFNRRFAPHIRRACDFLRKLNVPVAISYRINAGTVPAEHWIHNKRIGGGRIIGEVCHFIDLASCLAGSAIKSVSANGMNDMQQLSDTLTINLAFTNGSIATISYFSNGSKELDKEYLEVFAGGQVLQLHDFKDLTIYGKTKKTYSLARQDKGHKHEVLAFLEAIRSGTASPVPFNEIYSSMLATFKVQESVALQGRLIEL